MKKKLTAFILALASVGCFMLASCGGGNSGAGNSGGDEQNSQPSQSTQIPKTDEEKIRATVNKFAKEYNDGNFEGVLECMEPKMRNTMRALFNTLGGIAGGKLGVDIDLADLFSLGVGMEDGDFINFDIQDVAIGDGKASVTAHMNLAPATSETMHIILVKEDGEWLIENITDKKSSIGSGKTVVATRIGGYWGGSAFVDGIATIMYEQDGKSCWGILNTNGEVVYGGDGTWSPWNHLGNGMGWIGAYNQETDVSEKWILNSRLDIIATSTELGFDEIIGSANGCAWVYKYQSGISGAKYLYNCVDENGELMGEWFDLQIPYNTNDYSDVFEAIAVGKEILIVESKRVDFKAVLNIKEGKALFLDLSDGTYINKIYTNNENIYGSFGAYYASIEDVKNDKPIILPDYNYYHIKQDLTIETTTESVVKGVKDIIAHSEYDEETGEETNYLAVYDRETGEAAIYTDYPAEMIKDVERAGDYWLVTLQGLDHNYYFTLIGENGKQQFEPIMKYRYGNVVYTDNMLVYLTKNDGWDSTNCRYEVVDMQGNVVVPESAGYCYISAFSDGLAVAQIGETEEWVVIDNKGNVVLDTFTVKE